MVCQFLSSLTNLSNMKIKAQFPWCFQIQVLHLGYSEDENSAYEAKSILTTSFCVETIRGRMRARFPAEFPLRFAQIKAQIKACAWICANQSANPTVRKGFRKYLRKLKRKLKQAYFF